MSRTIVFFHAHPDDEALFTGGTMARAAAEGHRVVLVTATDGEAGLASSSLSADEPLGEVRRRELALAARVLGCARVVGLGYADSGTCARGPGVLPTFATTSADEVAARVARLLDEEEADVLTIYDPAGGYGHADHRQVHLAGVKAAVLAGTPCVLEATVDRRALQRALRLVSWVRPGSPELRPERFDALYTHHDVITHCVDVGAYLQEKRSAMAAHVSQTTGDGSARTLAWFLGLPAPVFGLAFGREWFVERGRRPEAAPLDNIFAGVEP